MLVNVEGNQHFQEVFLSTAASTRSSSQAISFNPALEEKIRLRAYELYLRRGAKPGNALEDWLRAESELISEPAAAPVSIAAIKRPRAKPTKK